MTHEQQVTHDQRVSPDRLSLFSDAVIAVVITIMVLELKAPEASTFGDLWRLWPTAISYLVSFVFIAIIWTNHHHLLRFVKHVTPRLIWVNFAHLFGISLVPFATAWIANAEVASAPVTLYAAIFVFINIAYRMFEKDALDQADPSEKTPRAKQMARKRSLGTMSMFVLAAVVALFVPVLGLALICGALILYLRPEAPGALPGTGDGSGQSSH